MALVKTNCHECIHSGDNQEMNSAHIHCKLYWKMGHKYSRGYPVGQKRAVEQGWYNFPYDYDPIWMIEECAYFEPKSKVEP